MLRVRHAALSFRLLRSHLLPLHPFSQHELTGLLTPARRTPVSLFAVSSSSTPRALFARSPSTISPLAVPLTRLSVSSRLSSSYAFFPLAVRDVLQIIANLGFLSPLPSHPLEQTDEHGEVCPANWDPETNATTISKFLCSLTTLQTPLTFSLPRPLLAFTEADPTAKLEYFKATNEQK
jgi:hypothetical protein